MDVLTYKCPCCGAPLKFNSETQNWKCGSCGNEYPLEVLQELEKDKKGEGKEEINWGSYREKQREEGEVQTYTCQSCGAEIVADPTTAATICPYCDSVVVLEQKVSGGLEPDYVIPFQIDRKQAERKLKEFCKGKAFLPKNFLNEKKIKEVQGLYVPFWLFDCKADANISYDATRVNIYSDANFNYTETKHYLIRRSGSMAFEKIPVDGSEKMDDTLMEALEPYDYRGLKEFSPAYLSGYVADRFDTTPEKSKERANERLRASVENSLRSSVVGFSSVTVRSRNISIQEPEIKYALLPVWILHAKYAGKMYTYAINGQTGKIVGELPKSAGRMAGTFFGIAAALSILGMLLFL